MKTIYIYKNSATGKHSYTVAYEGKSFTTDQGTQYNIVDEVTRMGGVTISVMHEETVTLGEYFSGRTLKQAIATIG